MLIAMNNKDARLVHINPKIIPQIGTEVFGTSIFISITIRKFI
jgi:hypothetical protein